ncbi:MAG TPA: hypothetical protein PLU50_08420, partial [Pseudobdellovibrionaceae bacterium]|nr:hypothetical protein [Pseudobdellovibrionaceae bacterium]
TRTKPSFLDVRFYRGNSMNATFEIKDEKFILTYKGIRQTLSSRKDKGSDVLEILWAGDIDGDNKLDYFIRISEPGAGKSCLYLSSDAKHDEIVHQSVCHQNQGC